METTQNSDEIEYLFPLRHPFRWLISGRSNSGKTTLLINTLTHPNLLKDRFDATYLISPTAFQDTLWDLVDYGLGGRLDVYTEELLEKLVNQILEDTQIESALIVLDDITSEKIRKGGATQYQNYLDKLFFTIRHLKKLSIAVAVHKTTAVTQGVRDNADGISFNRSASRREREVLADEYGAGNVSLKAEDIDDIIEYSTQENPYEWNFIMRQNGVDEYRKGFGTVLLINKN